MNVYRGTLSRLLSFSLRIIIHIYADFNIIGFFFKRERERVGSIIYEQSH